MKTYTDQTSENLTRTFLFKFNHNCDVGKIKRAKVSVRQFAHGDQGFISSVLTMDTFVYTRDSMAPSRQRRGCAAPKMESIEATFVCIADEIYIAEELANGEFQVSLAQGDALPPDDNAEVKEEIKRIEKQLADLRKKL